MVYIPCINKHMREDAMPDPTPYVRGYSFTNHQADKPAEPLPGNRLDVELDEISARSAELTERVNAGFDVSLNQEQLETVAGSIAEVVFVAENMPDVRDAADLIPSVEALSTLYLGAAAANPATGPSGAPLTIGAIYYNTVANEQRTWTGAGWDRLTTAAASNVRSFSNVAALLASAEAIAVGSFIITRDEHCAFAVVASDPDLTTAGSVLLRALPDARGWLYPEQFGAAVDGVTDDRPSLQAALDRLFAMGGGVLGLRSKTYLINSATSFDCVRSTSVSEGTLVPVTLNCGLLVRAGVSIVGGGSSASEINVAYTGTLANGIGCVEYANARLSGFRLTGPGAAGNGAGAMPHGIELSLVQDGTHINDHVTFDDLRITDWASYGIGHQYGHARDCAYRNIIIEDVGADGIDHKVRFGPLDPNWDGCKGVSFENIIVRRHGQRTTGVSGMDIRGVCSINQIWILEAPADCYGVSLSAGIAQGDDEIRTPSARSTLTNFFIEAADPDDTVVGLHLFSGGPSSIGDGYIHWCKTGVWAKPASTSPSEWRDSQSISNVIVEGARDGDAFLIENPRTYLANCRSIADVQYFDEKRGFVMDGGTTYPIKGGYSGGSLFVFLNGTAQTSGVDFNVSGGNLVFAAPLSAGDEVIFVRRTGRAINLTAQHCSVVGGGCDEFHNVSFVLADAGVIGTTTITGFSDGTGAALLTRTVSGALVHQPAGAATDIPFEFRGKGAGGIRIPFLPTSSAGLPSGQLWNDAGTVKIVP